MSRLLDELQIVPGIMPVNLASGAANGDWVCLKNYESVIVLFLCGVGAASQDPTLTLRQAKDVSGTTPAALNFTTIESKQASALTAVGQFTKVTQSAGNTYTNDTAGENQKMWAVEIKGDDLDVENGYDCVQAQLNDPGTNSQIGTVIYILGKPRYAADPLPSAIVD
ncbi:MAG: hypothetical protein ACK4NA_12800 [Alphaproteobacteria bacterium]